MAHPLTPAVALALVLLAGPALAQAPGNAAPAAADAVSVRTQRFEHLALQPLREAPATIVPRNEARLAAEVSGRVQSWTVDTGGDVERGAVLVTLDPTDYRLARDRARAALDASTARLQLAESQLKRARDLVAQGFFSQEALNSRETEVQLMRTEQAASRTQLAAAERALEKTRIAAPFAGTVKERLAQAGEFVAPGTALYVLTQTDDAEVRAQVALADVDSVRDSGRLEFVGAGTRVPLELLRISSVVTAPARTVEVRLRPAVAPENRNGPASGDREAPGTVPRLVVGAQGQFVWRVERPHVPASAIVQRERQLGVFVVERGKAKFVPLPGAQEGRAALAPLQPGAEVVIGGQAALRDGQPVTVLH